MVIKANAYSEDKTSHAIVQRNSTKKTSETVAQVYHDIDENEEDEEEEEVYEPAASSRHGSQAVYSNNSHSGRQSRRTEFSGDEEEDRPERPRMSSNQKTPNFSHNRDSRPPVLTPRYKNQQEDVSQTGNKKNAYEELEIRTTKRSERRSKVADGHQIEGYQTGGYQTGAHQAGGHQMGGHQTGVHQMGGHQTGGHQTGGNQMGGHQMGGRGESSPVVTSGRQRIEQDGSKRRSGGKIMRQAATYREDNDEELSDDSVESVQMEPPPQKYTERSQLERDTGRSYVQQQQHTNHRDVSRSVPREAVSLTRDSAPPSKPIIRSNTNRASTAGNQRSPSGLLVPLSAPLRSMSRQNSPRSVNPISPGYYPPNPTSPVYASPLSPRPAFMEEVLSSRPVDSIPPAGQARPSHRQQSPASGVRSKSSTVYRDSRSLHECCLSLSL